MNDIMDCVGGSQSITLATPKAVRLGFVTMMNMFVTMMNIDQLAGGSCRDAPGTRSQG